MTEALSEILRSVRLRSSVLSRATMRGDWSVRSEGMSDGSAVFHAFVQGAGWLRHASRPHPLRVERGDLVLLTRGDAHELSADPALVPTPIVDHLAPIASDAVPHVDFGPARAPETRILCGSFRADHGGAQSFLAALPPLLHARTGAAGSVVAWSDATVALVEQETALGRPAADALLERLAEILFIEILRACAAELPERGAGWIAAVCDDAIARALALIHGEPQRAWTADTLARRVALSRTSFFERFTRLVGEPPAQYLGRWRAQTAADLLRHTDLATTEIAERVGYTSADAFARAFKRHLGKSPAVFRRA